MGGHTSHPISCKWTRSFTNHETSVVDYEQSGRQHAGPSFTEDELKSFVLAAIAVQRITEDCSEKLQEAKSPEEQQEIKQAAVGEMVRALETEGISVDKYQEISNQAQANQDIAERLKQHIESMH